MSDSRKIEPVRIHCSSQKETERIASQLATLMQPGQCLCLSGDLGAGKTTFVRAFATVLGIDPQSVNSPTYVIVQHYLGDYLIHHFDLYRVESEDELYEIGAEELIESQGLCLIEWPEKYPEFLPDSRLEIQMTCQDESARNLELTAIGENYALIAEEIRKLQA